jgi:hypothetical protein
MYRLPAGASGTHSMSLIAGVILMGAATALPAAASDGTPAAPGPMVAIQPLTKYTLPDMSASVMLPQGWKVTQTGVAFIRAAGPMGEIAMFGVTVPAHDGPDAAVTPGQPLSQPYSASAGDKLNKSIQWVRAANRLSPVQVLKVFSSKTFAAPKEFGVCDTVTVTLGLQAGGVLDAESDLCSLPKDSSGNYRNFLKIIAVSPALSTKERATLEAVLSSYILNLKAVEQRMAQTGNAPVQNTGPAATTPMQRSMRAGPATPQSLQQQINAEIAAGGFSPQMVAAMRAQATATANAVMAPAMAQAAAVDRGVDYFDRTVLRGQIPVAINNQGTFWIDPN